MHLPRGELAARQMHLAKFLRALGRLASQCGTRLGRRSARAAVASESPRSPRFSRCDRYGVACVIFSGTPPYTAAPSARSSAASLIAREVVAECSGAARGGGESSRRLA